MEIIVCENYDEMSKLAAETVIEQIRVKPDSVMGFATGKTPLGLYGELIKAYKQGRVDFSKVVSFNLDEYYPIDKGDKKSMHYYMHKNFFDKVNFKKKNINLFDGSVKDFRKECERYEKLLRKYKIDLQILGLGVNGHIGYNEPSSSIDSNVRFVELSPETLKNKKISLKGSLTMGVKNILTAKKLLLLASGKEKSRAVRALKGKISSKWPVSYLRNHRDLWVILDKFSSSKH